MHIMNKKTQIQIASEAGITQGYLSKIFAGLGNPTLEVLQRISKASGMSVSKIMKIREAAIKEREAA